MQPSKAIVLCVALFALIGCGSHNDAAPSPSNLPSFTVLERLTSSLQDYDQNGIDAVVQSPGAMPSGSGLHLASTPGTTEWAIWQFSPLGRVPQNVWLNLSGTDEAWIGLSDFVHERWQFSGPYGSGTLNVNLESGVDGVSGTGADYLSATDKLFVCVVVTGPHVSLVDSLSLSAEGNSAPVAALSATPPYGQPGEPVVLDASASTDSDGTIAKYEWDLDGDGSFEQDTGATAQADTNLPNPAASQLVWVRVTDDEGATATASLPLRTWSIVMVDNAANVGRHTSIAIVNGRPAIAYNDATNFMLKYVQAIDAEGVGWGPPQTLTAGGYWNSLAVINGNPAVSTCASFGGGDLKYVRSFDADGLAWPGAVIAHGSGLDTFSSLAEVNGRPAISYYDGISTQIGYVRATDAAGDFWGPPTAIYNAGDAASSTSLLEVNGNPAAGYWDNMGYYSFSRSVDQDGITWGLPFQIYVADGSQASSSFKVVNGNPAAALYDLFAGILYYARATDTDGTNWAPAQAIHSAGNVGKYPSLAVVGGVPAVSYYSTGATKFLHYIQALDADGTSWGPPQIVDSTSAQTGQYNSLVNVNGVPGISYYDAINFQLKFATLR